MEVLSRLSGESADGRRDTLNLVAPRLDRVGAWGVFTTALAILISDIGIVQMTAVGL
jgi:hypothetical protein